LKGKELKLFSAGIGVNSVGHGSRRSRSRDYTIGSLVNHGTYEFSCTISCYCFDGALFWWHCTRALLVRYKNNNVVSILKDSADHTFGRWKGRVRIILTETSTAAAALEVIADADAIHEQID
jgi:hypothetical protein